MSTTVAPQRRGGAVALALALVLGLVIIMAAGLILARPALFGRGEQTITSEELGASFNDIAELSTEEYVFTKVGTFDDAGFRIAGRAIPFTGKKFAVTYGGRVTAGIRNAELIRATID
ncbi:MAG: DUF4230 domain-containing protein, partial [Corynebacterium sp.]|nr:DUF4230 domain-containing protein [Corynebacterium sp.]